MSCNNNTGLDIIRMIYSSEHKLHSYKGKLWSASSPVSVCPPLSRAPRKAIGGPTGGALFASTIVLLLSIHYNPPDLFNFTNQVFVVLGALVLNVSVPCLRVFPTRY